MTTPVSTGVAEFDALFTIDGELVSAVLALSGRGYVWALLASDDPYDAIIGTVAANPDALAARGFREGLVRAPARMVRGVDGQIHVERTDGEFSRLVEVIS